MSWVSISPHHFIPYKGDYFRFGLIFFLKITKLNFFFKTKTGSNWLVSVWLGFLGQKPAQTGLTQFFPVRLGFFLVWVRFSFFDFRLIKPKPNQTGRFFLNFNRFFFTVRFFWLIFFIFSSFYFFCSPLISRASLIYLFMKKKRREIMDAEKMSSVYTWRGYHASCPSNGPPIPFVSQQKPHEF
jgi:hypothetical protein